jgi:L-serine/L-threonine ammonia-lyase
MTQQLAYAFAAPVPICLSSKSAPLAPRTPLSPAMTATSKRTKPMHVQTPLHPSPQLSVLAGRELLLKMETSQPSGSYKIRGVGHLCQKAFSRGVTHFVSSSGGNAGAAVAYAGGLLGVRTTVCVPSTTPRFMLDRLRGAGAEVVVHGDVWDAADVYAREMVEKEPVGKAMHISPFDHPDLWEGHASIVSELVGDLGPGVKPAGIVVSVGGGGLFLGVAEGCHAAGWDDVPIVAAETIGAASFNHMIVSGCKALPLPGGITSIAKTLGATKVSDKCADLARTGRDIHSTVVSDQEAVQACAHLATHHRVLTEPACGAAVAALLPGPGPVIVIVCGGNMVSPTLLAGWLESTGASAVEL